MRMHIGTLSARSIQLAGLEGSVPRPAAILWERPDGWRFESLAESFEGRGSAIGALTTGALLVPHASEVRAVNISAGGTRCGRSRRRFGAL